MPDQVRDIPGSRPVPVVQSTLSDGAADSIGEPYQSCDEAIDVLPFTRSHNIARAGGRKVQLGQSFASGRDNDVPVGFQGSQFLCGFVGRAVKSFQLLDKIGRSQVFPVSSR